MDEWGSDILSPEFRSVPSDIDMGPESKDLEVSEYGPGSCPQHREKASAVSHLRSMANSADLVAALAEETGYPVNVLEGRVDLTELGLDDSAKSWKTLKERKIHRIKTPENFGRRRRSVVWVKDNLRNLRHQSQRPCEWGILECLE